MSQPIKETVLVTKAGHGVGAALTQVTNAAGHVTISIPAGKGGILFAVSFSSVYTLETLVNSGGVATLRNSAADWDPFYVPTGTATAITAGGNALKPFVFECFKKLPGNSTVSIDYIPFNNQSQYLEVTLHWIMTDLDPEVETFVDLLHPLEADKAGTAGTRVRRAVVHLLLR